MAFLFVIVRFTAEIIIVKAEEKAIEYFMKNQTPQAIVFAK